MRRLVVPLLAAGLLLGSAGIVAADEPIAYYVLDPANCALSTDQGELVEGSEVPAGSEVFLFEGWLTKTRGQLQAFIEIATWVLIVSGQSVDLTADLSGPLDVGSLWGDFFFVSAGIVDVGQPLTVHYDNVLRAAHYDGFAHYPIGSVYGGGVDCTITAST
jgi:hypothetical protein